MLGDRIFDVLDLRDLNLAHTALQQRLAGYYVNLQ
jgi:hypothetical protein